MVLQMPTVAVAGMSELRYLYTTFTVRLPGICIKLSGVDDVRFDLGYSAQPGILMSRAVVVNTTRINIRQLLFFLSGLGWAS